MSCIDGEEFRPIPGYEAEYSISRSGRIVSNKFPGREKKITVNKLGQKVAVLSKNSVPKMFTISRLIYLTFESDCNLPNQSKRALTCEDPSSKFCRVPKKVRCLELDKEFDSIIDASKAVLIDYAKLRKAIKNGKPVSSRPMLKMFGYTALHFEEIE